MRSLNYPYSIQEKIDSKSIYKPIHRNWVEPSRFLRDTSLQLRREERILVRTLLEEAQVAP